MDITTIMEKITTTITLRCPLCGAVKQILKALDIYPTKEEKKTAVVHLLDCICPDCEEVSHGRRTRNS